MNNPRIVLCRRFKEELEGLEKAPFPGAKGQDVFENVSKKAWLEWLEHQTRIINEQELNMMDMNSRKYLQEQMAKYFAGEAVDQAEGFVPPTKPSA